MIQSEEGVPPVNKLLYIIKQLGKIIRIRRHFVSSPGLMSIILVKFPAVLLCVLSSHMM